MEFEMDQFATALAKKFNEMERRIADLEERCDEIEAAPPEADA